MLDDRLEFPHLSSALRHFRMTGTAERPVGLNTPSLITGSIVAANIVHVGPYSNGSIEECVWQQAP